MFNGCLYRQVMQNRTKIGHKSMSVDPDATVWIRQNRLILYPSRLDCFVFQIGISSRKKNPSEIFKTEAPACAQHPSARPEGLGEQRQVYVSSAHISAIRGIYSPTDDADKGR
jgi:hypothetical protein